MEEKKRFQKKTFDSKDYKGMENGAKALRGGAAIAAVTTIIVAKNKGLFSTLAKNAGKLARGVLKR